MSDEPDRLQELTEKIQALVTTEEQAERDARPEVHWVHGGDEGIDWCHACCVKEVARLTDAGQEVSVDGGWGPEDSDSIARCEGCGCDLNCNLTAYGCEEEVAHFETYPPVSLELLDTLESFYDDPIKHPTLYGRLVVLAEALLAILETDPARKEDTP